MKHVKKYENNEGKILSLNNPVANMVAGLNKGEESAVINNFNKFEKMKNQLISDLNSKKLIGNTASDLGNFIGQSIYSFLDDDNFSEEDFMSGFEYGVDAMKEPSKSKWHNFK